jgi:response regulator RpfG family c-di-GMP phosphodiesterase
MHDNLIMSLAMMVESRDNSTGGHIKRTSEGVRILIDEIIKEGTLPLSEKFCKDVIKAAPMHDLGKIAVDDALVSKRVYKEAFDYEKADRIIMEGMGTQFDPGLKSAYEKARPKLEEYYGGCS